MHRNLTWSAALLLIVPATVMALPTPIPLGNGTYDDFDGPATLDFAYSGACGGVVTIDTVRHFLGQDVAKQFHADLACTPAGDATVLTFSCTDEDCDLAGVSAGGITVVAGTVFDGVMTARLGTPA